METKIVYNKELKIFIEKDLETDEILSGFYPVAEDTYNDKDYLVTFEMNYIKETNDFTFINEKNKLEDNYVIFVFEVEKTDKGFYLNEASEEISFIIFDQYLNQSRKENSYFSYLMVNSNKDIFKVNHVEYDEENFIPQNIVIEDTNGITEKWDIYKNCIYKNDLYYLVSSPVVKEPFIFKINNHDDYEDIKVILDKELFNEIVESIL